MIDDSDDTFFVGDDFRIERIIHYSNTVQSINMINRTTSFESDYETDKWKLLELWVDMKLNAPSLIRLWRKIDRKFIFLHIKDYIDISRW